MAYKMRECSVCRFTGKMNTWFDYLLPLFLAVILLCVYVIPGLILIAFMWGKFKCPNCGALGTTYLLNHPKRNALIVQKT